MIKMTVYYIGQRKFGKRKNRSEVTSHLYLASVREEFLVKDGKNNPDLALRS